MTSYYNEKDRFAASWLRELIKVGCIAEGEVDERDIEDVRPNDLREFAQCHFFAGIGVWSYALRSAGWPDDRPVWTGSCPCQPFSAAGKRKRVADERHLWPSWFYLIKQCRPETIFGEQVASKDGLGWLDLVHDDLEGAGYTVGAVDTCAAGFGAPHIRQRLYFAGHPSTEGLYLRPREKVFRRQTRSECKRSGDVVELAHPNGRLPSDGDLQRSGEYGFESQDSSISSFWSACDWLPCIDGKYRPVEPSTFPLAHGTPNRVGRLRGYGNALCAPQAQGFIEAYMEVCNE